VVPGDGENRRPEGAEKRGRAGVLVGPAAVRQVAAGDDELGLLAFHQGEESRLQCRILLRAHVEIRDVEEEVWHGRWRL
jgi:hypothetical protein